MGLLDNASVRRVRDALAAADARGQIMELNQTARTAQDAANAIGVELGAIVKSLVFIIGGRPVMALISGDRRCRAEALGPALGLEGKIRRADADGVREATGFAIGGVAPIGLVSKGMTRSLPMAMDQSLARFPIVYAAAGHPHCVFPTEPGELGRLTGAVVSGGISEPLG